MELIIGAGIGAVVVTAYLGRKGWLAFHRAVGITPSKVTYIAPKSDAKIPKLIALQVDSNALRYLPDNVIATLQRIDDKADTYRRIQQAIKQTQSQEMPYLEDEFVVAKLLNEHLPQIITIYVNYLQVKANPTGRNEPYSQDNELEAYQTLVELLEDIERRLDALLLHSENERLHELKVMKRYLDSR